MSTTTRTPAERFRFRDARPARFDECTICGLDTRCTSTNPFPRHDHVAHEVWAFETYGMHAVVHPAREHVEAWATSDTPPSPDAALALLYPHTATA